MMSLYKIDQDGEIRTSHGNPAIVDLYEKFLGEPCGHKSHEILHTRYTKRETTI